LVGTGLFSEPERDLREAVDLRATAKEVFLFAAYAARDYAFFVHNEEELLRPIGDGEALAFPWVPFTLVKTFDLEGFYREPSLDSSNWIEYALPLERVREDPQLLGSLLQEEKGWKYVKFLPPAREMDPGGYSSSTFKGHVHGVFKAFSDFLDLCKSKGVESSDVLVVFQDPLKDEAFYQYLAGVMLRRQNYLVTERALGVGLLADIYAYRAEEFSNGAFLLELSLGLGEIGEGGSNEASAALVEAESTAERGADQNTGPKGHGIGQALRYLEESRGRFGKGFVSAPFVPRLAESEKRVGVVTFDKDGGVLFKDAPNPRPTQQEASTVEEARALLRLSRIRSRLSYDGELRVKLSG
jgi:hypothetical protein